MSKLRLLVGTRKGAFILSSDATRKKWKVDGPQFAGWEIYHLKGSPADPGQTWAELPGLRTHESSASWAPGAGGLCLHTILIDPSKPDRMYGAISAAGVFRTDDGGKSWQPANKGLRSNTMPDQDAEVGHCVHRLAMHPSRPKTLFMQKHWDVIRTDDGGDTWREISGDLPTDFRFVIDVNANEPETGDVG